MALSKLSAYSRNIICSPMQLFRSTGSLAGLNCCLFELGKYVTCRPPAVEKIVYNTLSPYPDFFQCGVFPKTKAMWVFLVGSYITMYQSPLWMKTSLWIRLPGNKISVLRSVVKSTSPHLCITSLTSCSETGAILVGLWWCATISSLSGNHND